MGTEAGHPGGGRVRLLSFSAVAPRFCSAVLVLGVGTGCRSETNLDVRLPYHYLAKVDTKRAWVDVEVNGVTVLQLPEPAAREFGEYFSETDSRAITPWIMEGANEVVFRVTAADDSGRQHRELELGKSLAAERKREPLFFSESRELGVFTATVNLAPASSGSCDLLSDTERTEVLGAVQALYDAINRGDFETFKSFSPDGDRVAEVLGPYVESGWEISEGAPPVITPLDVGELRVVKSCPSDAIFVTTKDGTAIIKYEFVAPNERTRHRSSIHALAFRKINGAWKDIH
jgi:hypothetical protein